MPDFGRSDDPRVQAQLDRLACLSVPQARFGLETIRAVMERLGNPHRQLPPVFHVAGTNGKGSVCAFLRAILEADGKSVHVTTSPHLVRYNERIRIAGRLIEDGPLAALLEEVLDETHDLAPSFFEVTIAAAFLAFARDPADAAIIEVGLGGRLDATNVLEPEAIAACGIAALGLDHERFLLAPEAGTPDEPLARIAFEKAGIAKAGAPLLAMDYDAGPRAEVIAAARRAGAPLGMRPDFWDIASGAEGLQYSDEHGVLDLPKPKLGGAHQVENAGLAIAMLRRQNKLAVTQEAMARGIGEASWPARMQKLGPGPLCSCTGGRDIWLDGGHNPSAGEAIARALDGPVHAIFGMLDNKNPQALTKPLAGRMKSLTIVPVPDQDCHPARAFGSEARSAASIEEALALLPDDGAPVLIAGSLYLAGAVLRANGEMPD